MVETYEFSIENKHHDATRSDEFEDRFDRQNSKIYLKVARARRPSWLTLAVWATLPRPHRIGERNLTYIY